MKKLTVGVLIDSEMAGLTADCDRCVVAALRRMAGRVVVEPFRGLTRFASWLRAAKPDVVFNLTEHAGGDRRKDSHICAVLDLLRVPYTGPGPKGLMLCRDKAVSKMIAARNGFRVPAFFEQPPREIPFPVVVKPRDLDSSAGISAASLVTTRAALQRRIDALRRHGAVLCEEYVEGREMVVGFVGRRVMPAREMILGGRERLFSWRLKHDADYRKRNGARMITPRLAPRVRRALEEAVLATAEGLEMHDYGRFDVRLAADGAWVFLEANPNPALVPQHRAFSKTWGGIGYDAMIEQIVRSALRRAGNGR